MLQYDAMKLNLRQYRKEGMFLPYNAMKKGGIKAVFGLKKLTV
jgi:hypothetical protein